MAKPVQKKPSRLRRLMALSVATVACYSAFGIAPKTAEAFFALEATQWLNKIMLGKQLAEQEIHTEKLFAIDEQTMRSVMALPFNTHGASRAAANLARDALSSQGMPYGMASALTEHARIFFISPEAALSPSRVVRTMGTLMEEEDRAIMESVYSVASQRDAASAASRAIEEAVSLSQGSMGQTQATMAGNQINAGVFSKLEAMETGVQAANYMQARTRAAELTEAKIAGYQQNYDTRDFVSGAYPAPEGAGGGGFSSFAGM